MGEPSSKRGMKLPDFGPVQWALTPVFIAAVALFAGSAEAANESEASQRLVGAFLGPMLLMAGLHARLEGYVHAKARRALLPLPLAAPTHWAHARHRHRLGLALSLAVGLGVFGLLWITGLAHRPWVGLAEFAWLGLFAWVLEPLIPAYAAYLGRRFGPDASASRAQQALGGGWTSNEAVVHLYAPAAGVLGAAALAMPGQLTFERAFEGLALRQSHVLLALGPLAVALLMRRGALRRYSEGLFEAVPWLDEAERSLSGDDYARAQPRFARLISDPWTRLRLVSLYRRVSVVPLRLAALLGLPGYLLVQGEAPGGIGLALSAACLLAWAGPIASLHDPGERARWSRFAKELPIATGQDGALPMHAWLWLCAPPLLSLSLLCVAWRMHA